MITRNLPRHNVRGIRKASGPVGILVLLAFGMAGLTACNGSDDGNAPGRGSCPLTVDTEAWRLFRSTGDRIMAGETPTRNEMEAFAATPGASTWCRSMKPLNPNRRNLANWLQSAFKDKLGQPLRGKPLSNRLAMGRSYRFSYDHRAAIDSMLAVITAPDTVCSLYDRILAWVDRDSLPDPVPLVFLPGRPALVFESDTLLVDTGVLAAGGVQQTLAQVLSLAYRNYEVPNNANPLECEGAEAVVETWRRIRGDGIGAFLEKRIDTYFGTEHPTLKKVAIHSLDIMVTANKLTAYSDSTLGRILPAADVLARSGGGYARNVVSGGGYDMIGYPMAATIAGNLGLERLRETASSTSAFVAAYQEAAALNPEPRPAPGAAGVPWYASMRPLPQRTYTELIHLLEQAGR